MIVKVPVEEIALTVAVSFPPVAIAETIDPTPDVVQRPSGCSGLRLLLGLDLVLPPEAGEAEAGRRDLGRTPDLVRLLEHRLTEGLLLKL